MNTSFCQQKPNKSPCTPNYFRSIGVKSENVVRIHTNVTRAQHNQIVDVLRIHVRDFIEEPIMIPQYLSHSMILFENIYSPGTTFPVRVASQHEARIKMRKFMNAFLDQCDTIIPIVFADEEGALS